MMEVLIDSLICIDIGIWPFQNHTAINQIVQ